MKRLFVLILSCFCFLPIFASPKNDTQVLKTGHWVYDNLYYLSSEQKLSLFLDTQPMTIGEIKFNFAQIDYDSLSENAKLRYKKLSDFLYKTDDFFKEDAFRLYINPRISPEFYYKTNKEIPWSFNYFINDYFITIPIILGFDNYFTIQTDAFIGKNGPSIQEPDNFTNIIYKGSHLEFLFPRFAYGSFGYNNDLWGFNFHIGTMGRNIGKTSIGSIIYNKTFETDSYALLNLYTKKFKYSMDVSEITNNRFLYLHTLNARLFKNFRLSVVEGSMINAPFELRFLNPLMIMHSYGARFDYNDFITPTQKKYYGESGCCAYFGVNFDYTPIKNLRIYGLYAQNEILDPGGSRSDESLSVPDSIGLQLGVDYDILLKNNDILKTNLEASYTSPYLYVKYTPDTSLFRNRWDMQSGGNVQSWIGSPLGPDSFAVNLGLKYDNSKFNVGLSYQLIIHGQNNSSMFSQKTSVNKVDQNGNPVEKITGVDEHNNLIKENEQEEVYSYYPPVQYNIADNDKDKINARDKGRYMWMSGTNEITNKIMLDASYNFTPKLKMFGKFVYTNILNHNNTEGKSEQGIELSLGCEYKLFE